ncbi:MAG: DUF2779 domain-containing protein [Acholeplasmatales bacterium]|nr:DUF2779 domain-containing protein [Acholeplasmatales bacterium]
MKVSKTRFINIIRCPRFSGLFELEKKDGPNFVSLGDDFDALMEEENYEKFLNFKESVTEELDELEENLEYSEDVMSEYFKEIEILASETITNIFPGKVTFNLDTKKQKYFEYEVDSIPYYCFLDCYQEDEENIRIFEVKSTTSSSISKLTYLLKGEKTPLFERKENSKIFYKIAHDSNFFLLKDKKYLTSLDKLSNRYSTPGKYVYDILFQSYVIKNALKSNKKISYYLVFLNHEYVYHGELDEYGKRKYPNELFSIIDVTSTLDYFYKIIESDVKIATSRISINDISECNLGTYCERKKNHECKYLPLCFKEKNLYDSNSGIPHLKDNTMFVYLHNHNGFSDSKKDKETKVSVFDLVNSGITNAIDIDPNLLNRESNKIQYDSILENKEFISPKKILAYLDTYIYPIYHIDFETFPSPLPRFKFEKCYTQSPFQISIHIQEKIGELDEIKDNYSFLVKDHLDHREEIAKFIVEHIKDDNGTILAYNCSFEKLRIKELSEWFPKYSADLMKIHERIVDLLFVVKGNSKLDKEYGLINEPPLNYYNVKLQGSYSIKKVLPSLSSYSYKGMEVANGTDAMAAYHDLINLRSIEFERKYEAMLKYCMKDTFSMFVVMEALRNKALDLLKNSPEKKD